MSEASDPPQPLSIERLPGVDLLRGIAVVAMIIYHFTWDLRYFGLIQTDVVRHPFWMLFARAIAGSFLMLAGISLVLATRHGFDWPKIGKRVALVGGAALLVTIGTAFAMPDSYVFFGILHAIALCSILALPFLRLPVLVTAVVAAAVFTIPWVLMHPLFDAPLLQWLGLGTRSPLTNDFVPVFPWLAPLLAGVVIGRHLPEVAPSWLSAQPQGASQWIARMGRFSLPIYLVHQPILMALLGALSLALPSAATPTNPDRVTREFRDACDMNCMKSGGSAEICMRYCTCAEGEIRKAQLWTPLIRQSLTPRQRDDVAAITLICTERARQ